MGRSEIRRSPKKSTKIIDLLTEETGFGVNEDTRVAHQKRTGKTMLQRLRMGREESDEQSCNEDDVEEFEKL